ncbi:hypothetical protein QYF36_008168 [Acer negundo]|nr:hypothetical protein QYF36_008168 [Acer negundo]
MQYLTDCVGYDGGHPRLVLVATQISTVEEMGIPPSPPLARRRSSSPTITYEHGELDSAVSVLVWSLGSLFVGSLSTFFISQIVFLATTVQKAVTIPDPWFLGLELCIGLVKWAGYRGFVPYPHDVVRVQTRTV